MISYRTIFLRLSALVFAVLCVLVLTSNAHAATYTVINTNDAGAGSLRQAILDAEATPGVADIIEFTIPGPGPHVITPSSTLPPIHDTVTIDGVTQTGTVCGTLVPSLPSASNTSHTLQITIDGTNVNSIFDFDGGGSSDDASNSVIRGLNLVNSAFFLGAIAVRPSGGALADNLTFNCNYIGTDITGTTAQPNNIGIYLSSTTGTVVTNNLISGNTAYGVNSFATASIHHNLIGTTADGTSALSNASAGVAAGLDTLVSYNLISGNTIGVQAFNTASIKSNIIGLNLAGTAVLANTGDGVLVRNATGVTVGGSSATDRNIISGNGTNGVELLAIDSGGDGCSEGDLTDASVLGNYIGTNISGAITAGFGNGGNGVMAHAYSAFGCAANMTNIMIGGSAGAANIIAGNGADGVRIYSSTTLSSVTGVSALLNTIYDNTGLGINLASDTDNDGVADTDLGVNPNDVGDIDDNANLYLNFPVLNSATYTSSNQVTINYSLNINPADPHTSYRVDFYLDNTDPSGYGEGRYFLGTDSIAGDVTNHTTNAFTSPIELSSSSHITAVTTFVGIGANGFNGSSEFAATIQPTSVNDLAPTGQNQQIPLIISLIGIISAAALLYRAHKLYYLS